VTVTRIVREYVPLDGKKDPKGAVKGRDEPKKKPGGSMMAMRRPAMSGGYDLERGIEVDFKAALKKKDAVQLDRMELKSNDELEAEAMMREMPGSGKKMKLVEREVKQVIDDNPVFSSSLRMASPAPIGHFLRVFGQTDRTDLATQRDNSPSMRQALMMLNGRLTNEAARVGALEPMYKLLTPKPDLEKAIRLAYHEILTREPSAEEQAEAKKIIQESKTALDGMADLRWALLNCNEFRYLP